MRDKKILIHPTIMNGTSWEDLYEEIGQEYKREELNTPKQRFPLSRRPFDRDHKMHRQHFKWSHYINQSGAAVKR